MNIAALRVCHRFATIHGRLDQAVAVAELAVVMRTTLAQARAAMEQLVDEGMLARRSRDWYTVTDAGAAALMADEAVRDRRNA